jgi:hypothetical protein
LTPAQEHREARDWLAQHKRDPFLWLVVLLPLTFATLTVGVPAVLLSAFPFSDAKRALGQTPQAADIVIFETKTFCKLPRGTYIFGYDIDLKTNKGPKRFGRICRDVVNGGWVFFEFPSSPVGG